MSSEIKIYEQDITLVADLSSRHYTSNTIKSNTNQNEENSFKDVRRKIGDVAVCFKDKYNTIIIISYNKKFAIKPYALSKISFRDGKFIHESLGTFFEVDGAKKYFTLEQGLEWTGGDTFDDYC